MQGLMMDRPLLISSLLDHAVSYHGDVEIVSRSVEGPIHRYTYADAGSRSKKLAKALIALGVKEGDRIGTIAWNTWRHFEIYYGVSGMGAVVHTINPRLFPEQIAYIVGHAEDTYLFVDLTFVPLIEALQEHLKNVKGIVIMTDEVHMPDSKIEGALCYETLVEAQDDDYTWPEFDEKLAAMLCYTSGTTGNPKGVLFSHRSTVLHSWAVGLPDALDLSADDAVLPVVPMFHASCWGLIYAAPMCGAKLIFPGSGMDGASVHEMIDTEDATILAGVPTVWLMLLDYLSQTGKRLDKAKSAIIGGAAAPRSMIEKFQNEFGVRVLHAWGMTEMSPVGTVGRLLPKHANLSEEERVDIQVKQGRGIFGVEMKIVGDDGNEQPRDGKAFGNLKVRGPWIASSYYKGDGGDAFDDEGWFDTGDVATLDPDGYMQITDRSKDVIKSGGEWISSIELENIAVGHPDVAEACVIGLPHPKWDERPLLLVVQAEGKEVKRDVMLEYYEGKIAKWWLPDDVVIVKELPHTATGKLLKTKLREEYVDYKFPTA